MRCVFALKHPKSVRLTSPNVERLKAASAHRTVYANNTGPACNDGHLIHVWLQRVEGIRCGILEQTLALPSSQLCVETLGLTKLKWIVSAYYSSREKELAYSLHAGSLCAHGHLLCRFYIQCVTPCNTYGLCVNWIHVFYLVNLWWGTYCPLGVVRWPPGTVSHCWLRQWFPALDNSGAFRPQLPETRARTGISESFWDLQSKNTWVAQTWELLD